MNSNSRRNLVHRIADDIWNRGDLDVVYQVMAADATYHGPHMPGGTGTREDWKNAIAMYRSAFPDSHVVFDDIIAAGDTYIGRWRATGTHRGQLPNLEPTGKPIAIGGISVYRFAGDQIAEVWEQLDLLGMWVQLGVISLHGHR
jgi:predicted ester cyclase